MKYLLFCFYLAVCEKCGAIGVKHSFYTKQRNYCSQACVKSAMDKSEVNSYDQFVSKKINTINEAESTSVNEEPLIEMVCLGRLKCVH